MTSPGSPGPSTQAIHGFQAASPGSGAFETRLIELVAVAVHQIAVWVHKLDTSVHTGDATGDRPAPTYFLHRWYRDSDQYPEGISDCIG